MFSFHSLHLFIVFCLLTLSTTIFNFIYVQRLMDAPQARLSAS